MISKSQWVLIRNVEHFAKGLGNRCLFVTVTFPSGTSHQEVRRRWNSFTTNYLKGAFAAWIAVTELQANGTIHYHLVADAKADVYTGFGGFYKRGGRTYSRGYNSHLAAIWSALREAAPRYGVGRIQSEPVRNVEAIGMYLGKYLSKSYEDARTVGLRRVAYSRVDRLYHSAFCFVDGMRRANAIWHVCDAINVGDYETPVADLDRPKSRIARNNNFLRCKALCRYFDRDALRQMYYHVVHLRQELASRGGHYSAYINDKGLHCRRLDGDKRFEPVDVWYWSRADSYEYDELLYGRVFGISVPCREYVPPMY